MQERGRKTLETIEAFKAENIALQTLNRILVEAVQEMFEYLVDDIELKSLVSQEKWDRWQDIVDEQPIQLRLFD